jgi:uncharacterized protein DUF6930
MTTTHDPQLATTDRPEWVGGIAKLPMYITENGRQFRPSLILWLDADTEMILGTTILGSEDDPLGVAAANLRATAGAAADGTPELPGRVRVASPELADALRRSALDGIEVVCAPTPELDLAIDSLLERLAPDGEEPDLHYLRADVTTNGAAAMFRAAARLYRVKPWEVVTSDQTLIGITCESLELRDAVVSVIGQAGQVHGFVLFASRDDQERFCEVTDFVQRGAAPLFPHHLALTYLHRNDVGAALLEEIAAHHWEMAGKQAYPVISAVDQDGVTRSPTRSEMLRVETIAAALAEILAEGTPELEDALHRGSPLTLDRKLGTSAGELSLQVQVLAGGESPDAALLDEDGEIDEDRVEAYRIAILRRFEASPEAQAEPGAHWAGLLVNYATTYFGQPAESLSASEVHEIVFDIFPRKVSVEPEAAPAIIAGLRAFFQFVRREHPGSSASRCLAVLAGNASQQLAQRLADRSSFGPAKSFVMSGRAAGFDTSSQAGLHAWTEHMRTHDLRLPVARPAPSVQRRNPAAKPRAAQQAKKTSRKAQRAARKRSR